MSQQAVLILGAAEDEHAAHVAAALHARHYDVELLDSQWFPSRLGIAFQPAARTGKITFPSGRRLGFDEIRSVYWRNYNGVGWPELPDAEQAYIAENDSRSLFESLLRELPVRWVNGWEAFQLHQAKPAALAQVAALGVPIPSTLLTNEPTALQEFANEHRQAIFKPVQGGDQARRLTADHLRPENLASLQVAPVTVQAEIPGTNIRVFVVGERVMACEICTTQIDYRQDRQAELRDHSLSAETERLARQIARELKLLWTGIDFRLTPDGEYVFLEANPSPMFLGFEEATGLPLTESLVELLTGS